MSEHARQSAAEARRRLEEHAVAQMDREHPGAEHPETVPLEWVAGVAFRRPLSDDIIRTTDFGLVGPVVPWPGEQVLDEPPSWVRRWTEGLL